MTNLMDIKFGSVVNAVRRRLQTLAIVMFVYAVPLVTLSYFFILYVIFYTRYSWAGLAYLGYMVVDRKAVYRGSRPSLWVRRWNFWKYCADYFPSKLVKTADLDTSNNYLMCAFPHGVFSFGTSGNLLSEANNVSSVFPGLTHYMLTINYNLNAPVFREVAIWLGLCSASKQSLEYLLDKENGTGRFVILMIGGSAEAIITRPGSPRIFLKNRKGFVKLALRHGTSLVPVFVFGENDMYDQPDNSEGTWYRWVQNAVVKTLGFPILLLSGQGLTKDSFGILPRRVPLTSVVGKPMNAEHIPEPTQEQIDDLHSRFTEQLVALFEEHKHHYLENPENTHLVID